ncbi:hypothetical protein BDZ91DRAFT_735998 [Kalaharituber pfeilii]|nr:hypothetical protein BDZ91DRAFT_735998 [Kalaharituber pfeilii]
MACESLIDSPFICGTFWTPADRARKKVYANLVCKAQKDARGYEVSAYFLLTLGLVNVFDAVIYRPPFSCRFPMGPLCRSTTGPPEFLHPSNVG